MIHLWSEFREVLREPEYVHVLLNPLPVYGLAVGILGLALALAMRSRQAQGLALTLIVFAGMTAWPVAHFGHAAYDRVYSMSEAEAQPWLNWHQNLAERAVWACYATAALAAASLAVLWKNFRGYRILAALTLVSAVLALALGGFAAFAGGKIRHSEFRTGPPPAWANTSTDAN